MIGSLMSRMGDAQKLSIQQLHQAVQDGTLPAYVGIPLIQDKMQQQQAASAPQPQKQPPIAQQIMQESAPHPQMMAQAQPQGIETAQSNLPQEGMAGGGIVAFAEGGLPEDDESDPQEEQDMAMLHKFQAQMEEQPEGGEGYGISALPSKGVGIDAEKKGGEGIKFTDKKHKYEKEIRSAAAKAGIPEDLFLHMMAKETGGLEHPESAVSKAGAQGIAQFMPATAKQYGIDPMDMNQALPAAAKMTSSLLKHYGGDQKLAAMAYNWGQGNVDKWLSSGADPSKIPGETRGYVGAAQGGLMSYAGGGVVAFDEGGTPADAQQKQDKEDFMMGAKKLGSSALDMVTLPARGVMGAVNTGIVRPIRATGVNLPYIPEEAFGGSSSSLTPYYDKYVRSQETPAAPAQNVQPSNQPMGPTDTELGRNQQTQEPSIDDQIAKATAAGRGDEDISSLRDMLRERQTSSKNQKSIDNYMALLQAGLGMMGGTSPYAMANIGQGASKGIATLADARKSQIADENAQLTGRLGLSRAELLEHSRRDALARQIKVDAANEKYRTGMLGVAGQKATAAANLAGIKAQTAYSNDTGPNGQAALQKEFADKYGKNWIVDPKLKFAYGQAERDRIRQYGTMGIDDTLGG